MMVSLSRRCKWFKQSKYEPRSGPAGEQGAAKTHICQEQAEGPPAQPWSVGSQWFCRPRRTVESRLTDTCPAIRPGSVKIQLSQKEESAFVLLTFDRLCEEWMWIGRCVSCSKSTLHLELQELRSPPRCFFISLKSSPKKIAKSRNTTQKMQPFKQNELECHIANTQSEDYRRALYHPLDNYTTRKWVLNYELLS